MKCYKGFNKKLQCTLGEKVFQYKIGEEYMEKNASLCKRGFHACEYPLDCFDYYDPANSRFCEVELKEVSHKRDHDSKRCGKRIRIGAEIGIKGIIEASVKFILEKADFKNAKESNTGSMSVATNTGNLSVATNTGDRSVATNMGDCSAAMNTGNLSVATNTGYCSVAMNTGDRSVATNMGDYSAATNMGYCSVAMNTGDRSVAMNTGHCSVASVEGRYSVSVVTGRDSKVKGVLGCGIVAVERGEWNGITYPLLAIKAAIVDGKIIKPDTWYTLKGGEFMEVED